MAQTLVPACLSELKNVEDELAKTGADFWQHIWNNKANVIPKKDKYLMAFCAAVGSNRLKQAARELTKAYAEGATLEEITEIFEMMIWNTGIPYFTSEIVESQVMEVFRKIKLDNENEVPKEDTLYNIKTGIIHAK